MGSALLDRTGVNILVVHHLGNEKPPITTVEDLLKEANPPHDGYPNGYQYPEYEWGIIADGTIVPMRPLTVVGAHTTSDIPRYMLGDNWWNRNAASIVIANDNTKFAPTKEQVISLVNFIVRWMKEHRGTLDDIYKHGEVTRTDCPGLANWDSVIIPWVKGGGIVTVPVVSTPVVKDKDGYLMVRVLDSKADGVVQEIIKMGYATKRVVLP